MVKKWHPDKVRNLGAAAEKAAKDAEDLANKSANELKKAAKKANPKNWFR